MRGRISKCPRCGRVYEIQDLTVDRGMVVKRDLGTMITKDEEYYCQRCQNSMDAWRRRESWQEVDAKE